MISLIAISNAENDRLILNKRLTNDLINFSTWHRCFKKVIFRETSGLFTKNRKTTSHYYKTLTMGI